MDFVKRYNLCPHYLEHALTYRSFKPDEQALLEEVMYSRRDVRGNRFVRKPLPEEDLSRILKAGMMAPSVGFSQPTRFVVIREESTKVQIAKIFEEENARAQALFKDERQARYQALKLEGIFESAINLAVFYQNQDAPVLGQTSMDEAGRYSTVCAIQNMWLMARALNIGMGWVSILDKEKVARALGAQAEQELVAYLCIGPVDKFYDKPELEHLGWEQRKNLDDLVFNERLS